MNLPSIKGSFLHRTPVKEQRKNHILPFPRFEGMETKGIL